MGILARCALVVLVAAGATMAGLRRLAPVDTPTLRAVIQSDGTDVAPFDFDWASFAIHGELPAPDGLLTDDEIIALLLGTWGQVSATPQATIDGVAAPDDMPDERDDFESALNYSDNENLSDIVLDDLLGDGTVDDDSPFVTLGDSGFDELELVTHDEDEEITQRVIGADDVMNTSAGKWGGHRMAGAARGTLRFDASAARSSGLGMIDGGYFLDWPWSLRAGRNMFYWLVGPPALVFFVVGAMGVAGEMGHRSNG